MTTTKTAPMKTYPSAADIDSINSAIAHLQLAKSAQTSDRYSSNLRKANMIITNLWKAENL